MRCTPEFRSPVIQLGYGPSWPGVELVDARCGCEAAEGADREYGANLMAKREQKRCGAIMIPVARDLYRKTVSIDAEAFGRELKALFHLEYKLPVEEAGLGH